MVAGVARTVRWHHHTTRGVFGLLGGTQPRGLARVVGDRGDGRGGVGVGVVVRVGTCWVRGYSCVVD